MMRRKTDYAMATVMLVPMVAAAAETVARTLDGGARFWFSMIAVEILTLLGYACSSLAQWAKWPDGTLVDRLTIIQGLGVGLLAGNIAYYGAFYYLEASKEVVCFIGAAVAGFGGDKFLSPLLTKLISLIPGGEK